MVKYYFLCTINDQVYNFVSSHIKIEINNAGNMRKPEYDSKWNPVSVFTFRWSRTPFIVYDIILYTSFFLSLPIKRKQTHSAEKKRTNITIPGDGV